MTGSVVSGTNHLEELEEQTVGYKQSGMYRY